MIAYLLNVALIICTILVFYKVLLRNETFYQLNRVMLLSCLLFAFVLPTIHLPEQWSLRKASAMPFSINAQGSAAESNLTTTMIKSGQLTSIAAPDQQASIFQSFNLRKALIWIYWIGVAVFAINFIVQLLTLLYRAYSRPVIQDGRFRIVELAGDQAPCSFGNSIFINPEKYDWDTYSQILLHEKIHIQQGHSYDILLAELALVFQWFNPFAWLYRKAVEDNLEFLTDNDLLKHQEIDPSSYQLSLVKVSAPHFPVSLTTNYNQSILKKRLIMMNAKRSNINTTWKYLFIVPILMVFVCLLNEPIAYAKAQPPVVAKNTKDVNGINIQRPMQNEGNWFATIKNNSVNIRFEREGDENHNSSSNSTFQLSEFKNLPKDQEGDFVLSREAGTMHFHGKFNGNMGMGTYKFSPDKSFTSNLEKEGITMDGEDDALVYFMVDLKKSYVSMLKTQGFTDISKDELIPLAALKVDEPFIRSIKTSGFSDVSLQNLIPLKALGVDQAYVNDIKKSGYTDLSVDQLITLKAQGINGDFLKSSLQAQKESGLKSRNKERPEMPERPEKPEKPERKERTEIRERKEVHESRSDNQSSLENIIAMKALNVDAAFRNGFKQIGFESSDENLIAMKSLGITPEFVKGIRAAGFPDVETDEVISMKALGISTDEVKAYQKLGFRNISVDDVISAKATGVTPAYISSMKKQGHNFSSLEKYVETKAVTGSLQ
jgi:beta-lactamase regulating signal transducer with metallopeptidase domain